MERGVFFDCFAFLINPLPKTTNNIAKKKSHSDRKAETFSTFGDRQSIAIDTAVQAIGRIGMSLTKQ